MLSKSAFDWIPAYVCVSPSPLHRGWFRVTAAEYIVNRNIVSKFIIPACRIQVSVGANDLYADLFLEYTSRRLSDLLSR